MATATSNWTKDENGDLVLGAYRVRRRTGRYEVFNGQPEPVKKQLSKTAAMRWVEEQHASTPAAEVDPYPEFLAGLLAGSWTSEQITGDTEQPAELADYLTSHGLEQSEQWIIRALDSGELPERQIPEPVADVPQAEPTDETPAPAESEPVEHVHIYPTVDAMNAKAVKAIKAGNASDPAPKPARREKARDVQALADELVWKAGKNAWNRGDLPDLLTEFGLNNAELNDLVRERALEHFDARLKRNLNAERLNWTGPTEQETSAIGTAHVWQTECGTYRIIRVGGAEPRFAVLAKIIAVAAREREIANDLKTLRDALEKAEAWHRDQMELSTVKSNKEAILDAAVELGMHKRPAAQTFGQPDKAPATTGTGEESIMHVSEKNARGLLTALGVSGVEDFSIKKLTSLLNSIADSTNGDLPEDVNLRKLYKQVRQANDAGGKVSIGEASPSANGNGKPPKRKKPEAKKTKPSKSPTGRIKIMGKYSAGPFARWLGRNGVNYETAKKIMEDNGGCFLSEASLKWELKEVRDNKPPAPVEKVDSMLLKKEYGIKVKS